MSNDEIDHSRGSAKVMRERIELLSQNYQQKYCADNFTD